MKQFYYRGITRGYKTKSNRYGLHNMKLFFKLMQANGVAFA